MYIYFAQPLGYLSSLFGLCVYQVTMELFLLLQPSINIYISVRGGLPCWVGLQSCVTSVSLTRHALVEGSLYWATAVWSLMFLFCRFATNSLLRRSSGRRQNG
jgi:hypothetical protein